MKLTDFPALIVVAHATGCGHCEEFLPRLRPVAGMYSQRVPTMLIDLVSAPYLLDGLGISGTPATLFLRNGRVLSRLEGAADDYDVHTFYEDAASQVPAAEDDGGAADDAA